MDTSERQDRIVRVHDDDSMVESGRFEVHDNKKSADPDNKDWVWINKFWLVATVSTIALIVVLVATAIYLKHAAEAVKSKALMASDSEGEQDTEDVSSTDTGNNPRVTVNKALLDRMNSISMKLKASVARARSETSDETSSAGAEKWKSAAAPTTTGQVIMED